MNSGSCGEPSQMVQKTIDELIAEVESLLNQRANKARRGKTGRRPSRSTDALDTSGGDGSDGIPFGRSDQAA